MFELVTSYLGKYWKIISIVLILTSVGTTIGFVYSLTHIKDGCPTITSCRYELYSEEDNNQTFYGYYYRLNDKYLCKQWCSDKLDYLTCPFNDSKCTIDDTVKSACSIFHCRNKGNFVMSIICIIILIPTLTIGIVMIGLGIFHWRKSREPERIPLYAS